MHKTKFAMFLFCFASSTSSADVTQDDIAKFVEAALGYIAAGYQLSYVNQTECRKYSYKETANGFATSKNDVGSEVSSSMFSTLIETIEPMQSQLRQEVDKQIGEPTAYRCGVAEGMASKSFKQYQNNWLLAVSQFNQAKHGR